MNIYSVDGDYAKDVFTLSGNNGFNDDLYDEIYFARNSDNGIKSQQISMTDGFFKTPGLNGGIATSNDKLFAANIEVPLPFNIPVALFADLGTLGSIDPDISGKLLYDAGVMIRLNPTLLHFSISENYPPISSPPRPISSATPSFCRAGS